MRVARHFSKRRGCGVFQETKEPLSGGGSPSSFNGVRVLTVISQGNDDFPLAKVECLPGDGKYRPFQGLFRKTVFGKPSHFMLKWVFPKLSNEIPCLTPSYIGTLY